MDASRLTEERKRGKISQEEFFIRLNKLRLANNARACVASLEGHPPTSEARTPETDAICLYKENEDRVPDLGGTNTVISDGNSDGNNVDPEDPACGLRQDGERRSSMNRRVTESSGEYRQQDDNASQPLAGHSNPSTSPPIVREGSSKHRAPVLGNAPEYGASSERMELLPNSGSTHERTTPSRHAADCSVSTTRGLPPTGGVRCSQNPDGFKNSEGSIPVPLRPHGGESMLPVLMREPSPSWHLAETNINVEDYNRVAWVGLSPRGGGTSYFSTRHFLHPPRDIHPRITNVQSLTQSGALLGTRLCIRPCPNNECSKKQRLPCGNVISQDYSIPHQAQRERSLLNKDSQEPEGEARVSSRRPRTLDSASPNTVSGLESRDFDAFTSRREECKRRGDSCGNTSIPLSPPPYPRSHQGYTEQHTVGTDDPPASVTDQASSRGARCRPPSPIPPPMNDRQRRHRSDGDHGAEFTNHEDKIGTSSVFMTSGTGKSDEAQPREPPGSYESHAVTGRAGRKRAPGSLYERTTEWRARVCEAR